MTDHPPIYASLLREYGDVVTEARSIAEQIHQQASHTLGTPVAHSWAADQAAPAPAALPRFNGA